MMLCVDRFNLSRLAYMEGTDFPYVVRERDLFNAEAIYCRPLQKVRYFYVILIQDSDFPVVLKYSAPSLIVWIAVSSHPIQK